MIDEQLIISIFNNKRNSLSTTSPPPLVLSTNNNNSDSIWPDLFQYNNVINWENILFVGGRHPLIRYVQFFIACHGLIENLFYLYLSYEVLFLNNIDLIHLFIYFFLNTFF